MKCPLSSCTHSHLFTMPSLFDLIALAFVIVIIKGIFDKNIWMVIGGVIGCWFFM